MQSSQLTIRILRGKEIIPYIHRIAELRIHHFYEYPYVYEGDMACEEKYLRMYSQTNNAMLVIAIDNHVVVGVITGLPLEKSMQEAVTLFKEKRIPTDQIFYLGEIILQQEYRNQKIGLQMYQLFEKTLKNLDHYKEIAFCEVVRDGKDPRKPLTYSPLDSFWRQQGYIKKKDLIIYLSWKERGASVESDHPMVFWMKDLSNGDNNPK